MVFRKMKVFLIILILLSIIACQSQEEKDRATVKLLVDAVNTNNIDSLNEIRDKVVHSGKGTVPFLIEAMKTANGVLKSEIEALVEKMGDKAFTKLLIILPESNRTAQYQILLVLDYLNNSEAGPTLVRFINKLPNTDPQAYLAAKILAKTGNKTGFIRLNNMLLTGNKKLRMKVAFLYIDLANKFAFPALLSSMARERVGEIKIQVVKTLAKMKKKRAVSVLKKFGLHDKYSSLVRRESSIAIYKITGESIPYADDTGHKVFP